MSFKDFLKDKLGFLVYNFTFLIFTVSVIIFSPVDVFLTDTILYILVVNVVFLFLYLFISYIKKNKFLDKIKNDTFKINMNDIELARCKNEEKIYLNIIKNHQYQCNNIINNNIEKFGIEIYLLNQGYNVFKGYNGLEGLKVIENQEIHLAIVDIMMPKMDGITLTMKLRENYNFPVIMLSAKSEEVDKIMGLNIGADDYVTKPFKPLELLARVNSQLRRYTKYLNMVGNKEQKVESDDSVFAIGGLELNENTKEVSIDGKYIKTTPIEFKILSLLMRNAGRVFSADEIYERVWNENAVNTDTVMVHVRNIREKIEIDPKNPKYLKVVWGVGYKIEKI